MRRMIQTMEGTEMGYGIAVGNVMDGTTGVQEQGNVFSQLIAKLPAPVQVLLHVFVVVVVAAFIGMIIGKMYASIKYPDPEKHYIISPKLKVLFICVLAACCFWLYTTMTREEPPESDSGEETQQQDAQNGSDLPVGAIDGTTVMLR